MDEARERLGANERLHATTWYRLCLVADGRTVEAGYQPWRTARELEYTALDLADMDVDAWYQTRAAEGELVTRSSPPCGVLPASRRCRSRRPGGDDQQTVALRTNRNVVSQDEHPGQ